MATKHSYLKRKIGRLTREIAEIDKHFYLFNEDDDPVLHAGMLERKRDDIIRG